MTSYEKTDTLDDEQQHSAEVVKTGLEDRKELVLPVHKPLVVGQLEQLAESQTLVSSGQLQTTSAVSSVTSQQKQQEILKVQQSHMFGVIKTNLFDKTTIISA